jgi:hypothetical protein
MVYDRTCLTHGVGLSTAWSAGALLYRGLGRLDATFGATSWTDALGWLASHDPGRPIEQVQYWGHGRWGRIFVDADALDASALKPGHPLAPKLEALRERLAPDALVWLRTCEAFGAAAGQAFAERLADTLGARVAGHTFIIGAVQSGLRALAPGFRAAWSLSEGLAEGTPDQPIRAHASSVARPRTITCLANAFPSTWFDEDGA